MPRRPGMVVRVLRLIKLLDGRRYAPSLEEMATELGCSTPTIRRDLAALEEAGYQIPIWRHEACE